MAAINAAFTFSAVPFLAHRGLVISFAFDERHPDMQSTYFYGCEGFLFDLRDVVPDAGVASCDWTREYAETLIRRAIDDGSLRAYLDDAEDLDEVDETFAIAAKRAKDPVVPAAIDLLLHADFAVANGEGVDAVVARGEMAAAIQAAVRRAIAAGEIPHIAPGGSLFIG
ncbi:hypothetical protein J2T57_001550 [Natronocella acetinitrilica]|uniref:Uncharacterized protein n=1 Tax=Natronocella acetinitrilica TaxID=414046 RepID=A0AAE3KC31_9GAMM|nr:hypothetical protein [Natronocella acetinitrilica]MCP1674448.1 hypothetical protein [Natronocella acetinitrilica]